MRFLSLRMLVGTRPTCVLGDTVALPRRGLNPHIQRTLCIGHQPQQKNHRPVESSEKRPYRKSRQAKAPPRRADGSARNLDRAGRVHAHRAAAQAAWQRDNSRPLPRVAAARQQLLGAEALTLSASLAHRRGAVRTCKRNAGKGVYVYIYIYICLHASIL